METLAAGRATATQTPSQIHPPVVSLILAHEYIWPPWPRWNLFYAKGSAPERIFFKYFLMQLPAVVTLVASPAAAQADEGAVRPPSRASRGPVKAAHMDPRGGVAAPDSPEASGAAPPPAPPDYVAEDVDNNENGVPTYREVMILRGDLERRGQGGGERATFERVVHQRNPDPECSTLVRLEP